MSDFRFRGLNGHQKGPLRLPLLTQNGHQLGLSRRSQSLITSIGMPGGQSQRTDMVEERVQRRLAAILVADVVGYSRTHGEGRGGDAGRAQGASRRIVRPHDRRPPWGGELL